MLNQLHFVIIGESLNGLQPPAPANWSFRLEHLPNVEEAIAMLHTQLPDIFVIEEKDEITRRKLEKMLQMFQRQAYLLICDPTKPLAFNNQLDLLMSQLSSDSTNSWRLSEW